MRKAHLLIPVLLAVVFVQGCIVPCVHPLYRSNDDMVFDPELIGRWKTTDSDEVWEFAEYTDKNVPQTLYLVTITDDNEPAGILIGVLVEIDGRQFMDLSPYDFEYTATASQMEKIAQPYPHKFEFDSNKDDFLDMPGLWFNNLLLFPTHTILQIRRSGDTMKLALIEYDWITDRVKNGTLELAHETEDDLVLITAPSEELRGFARRYADDGDVFEFDELLRQKADN